MLLNHFIGYNIQSSSPFPPGWPQIFCMAYIEICFPNHYFKDDNGDSRQRKKTLLPFMVKLVLLNAFVCFSDLFSFDQNHLTLVFKGMFFAVLKSSCYNINPATCGERSRQRHPQLMLNKSVPLGVPGTWSTSAVSLVPVQREKSRLQSHRFPHFVRMFLYMQNPARAWFPEPSLSVFGEAAFLLSLKCIFLSSAQKNIPSLFIPCAGFKGKTKNTRCWEKCTGQHEHNELTTQPGSSHFPPIPCTDPGSMP